MFANSLQGTRCYEKHLHHRLNSSPLQGKCNTATCMRLWNENRYITINSFFHQLRVVESHKKGLTLISVTLYNTKKVFSR